MLGKPVLLHYSEHCNCDKSCCVVSTCNALRNSGDVQNATGSAVNATTDYLVGEVEWAAIGGVVIAIASALV